MDSTLKFLINTIIYYILMVPLETGIKQGYKLTHRKDIVIESDCNSLCMTVSMLNYGLIEKDLKKLNMLEKFIYCIHLIYKHEITI